MSKRETERLRQVANCYADIVRQVAECFVTEFEEDGSPCWAGKSPSLWVLDNLDAIKSIATLTAELDIARRSAETYRQRMLDAQRALTQLKEQPND